MEVKVIIRNPDQLRREEKESIELAQQQSHQQQLQQVRGQQLQPQEQQAHHEQQQQPLQQVRGQQLQPQEQQAHHEQQQQPLQQVCGQQLQPQQQQAHHEQQQQSHQQPLQQVSCQQLQPQPPQEQQAHHELQQHQAHIDQQHQQVVLKVQQQQQVHQEEHGHIRLHHQGHSEQPQREHHQEDHHLDKQLTHLHVDQLQDHHHVDQLQDQRQNNNIFIISDGHLKPIEEDSDDSTNPPGLVKPVSEAPRTVQLPDLPDLADGKGQEATKLGWIQGVLMKCMLNIWGVMLYLRLTWVVGQAGLIEGLLIIGLANVVTVITATSMSAISTNGRIKAGGIYFMISRNLGPELGGAIGLMFFLANSIAVAMYLIGFCESLLDCLEQFAEFPGITNQRINDIRDL